MTRSPTQRGKITTMCMGSPYRPTGETRKATFPAAAWPSGQRASW